MIGERAKKDVENKIGTKDDHDKLDYTLVDPYWEEEVVKVLKAGQVKYERGNWQRALDQKRILSALIRHTIAIQKGEEFDRESGLRHSAHIACNSMFLNYHERHGTPVEGEYE